MGENCGVECATGCLRSSTDDRDYGISRLVGNSPTVIPEEYSILRPEKIRNQGAVLSCVSMALASCREITETFQQHIVELSTGYIYANRRGHSHRGEGMIPREAIDSLMKYGVCKHETFPNTGTYSNLIYRLEGIMSQADICANPYKITSYARLIRNQDVKRALMDVGSVPVGYALYESFNSARVNGMVKIPDTKKEKWLGDHMMLIIGWKKINKVEHWVVLNSYGRGWGDNGLCYIPTSGGYDFFEAWAITDSIYPANQNKIKEIKFSTKPDLASRVTLDGVPYVLPTPIQYKDYRILVPLRFVSEALGCLVKWDGNTKEIIITKDNSIEIVMRLGSKQYAVNGVIKEMDTVPTVTSTGFTLVPLRFVAENLKCTVDWNEKLSEATIKV